MLGEVFAGVAAQHLGQPGTDVLLAAICLEDRDNPVDEERQFALEDVLHHVIDCLLVLALR